MGRTVFLRVPDGGLADGDDDEDACDNTCEYERGTDPTVPQTIAFTLEVVGAFDDQGIAYTYDSLTWLPKFGHTLEIQATWNTDYGTVPSEAVFSLKQTSSHPGRAVNDPDPTEMDGNDAYPDWYYDEAPEHRPIPRPGFRPDCDTAEHPGRLWRSVDCFDQGRFLCRQNPQMATHTSFMFMPGISAAEPT